MSQHESVNIVFGVSESPLNLCASKSLTGTKPVKLFEHLSLDFHPVITKRRKYSKAEEDFVSSEVAKLLADDIIELSSSPGHAQVVVTKNANHKKRMCIDYIAKL